MKTCNKCGVEKEHSGFNKDKSTKDGLQVYCKECKKQKDSRYLDKLKDGFWYVYLLPDHNYVGMSSCMKKRMHHHKYLHNRNTENVRILHKCKTKIEAFKKEVSYHALGYEG